MDTLDFNKHRVICKIYSLQVMMKKEKMSLKMKRSAVHLSPLQEIRASLIFLGENQGNMNMKCNNIISIVFSSKKTITSIINIFKKIILEFIWMVYSQLVTFPDSSILHINTHNFKLILLIIFSNSKIRIYFANKMINRNINQILIEKMGF